MRATNLVREIPADELKRAGYAAPGYLWFCEGCEDELVHASDKVAPLCMRCSVDAVFGSTGIPLTPNRDEAGKLVRDLWSIFVEGTFPNPPEKWIKPWNELAPPMQEVDRIIGEHMFLAMQCATDRTGLGELVQLATLYRYTLIDGAPEGVTSTRELFAHQMVEAAGRLVININAAESLFRKFEILREMDAVLQNHASLAGAAEAVADAIKKTMEDSSGQQESGQ